MISYRPTAGKIYRLKTIAARIAAIFFGNSFFFSTRIEIAVIDVDDVQLFDRLFVCAIGASIAVKMFDRLIYACWLAALVMTFAVVDEKTRQVRRR